MKPQDQIDVESLLLRVGALTSLSKVLDILKTSSPDEALKLLSDECEQALTDLNSIGWEMFQRVDSVRMNWPADHFLKSLREIGWVDIMESINDLGNRYDALARLQDTIRQEMNRRNESRKHEQLKN